MAGMIRVAIVDDHPATAEGLAALLGREADIEVVGSAGDLAGARRLIEASRPQVVLCDIDLAGERGFELLDDTGPGRPAVVFLTSYDLPAFYAAALERGAAGYLLKTAPLAEILRAIRTVASGGSAFSISGLQSAHGALKPPSGREMQVIGLVAAGRSNDEIATALAIEPATVESHLRRLFGRYGIANRTELALLAVSEGWTDITRPPGLR